MNLRLDWCSHQAAKYAVEHWHYSKSLPGADKVMVGAWEDGKFIGCVIFSRGANQNLGSPFGLTQFECSELTRVALTSHLVPVSRILALAVKWFKKQCPGIRLIVSYADTDQGHHGGIYQACGWVYAGSVNQKSMAKLNGVIAHKRTFDSAGKRGYTLLESKPKHKYLMPLDDEMRKQITPLAKPYPKRLKELASNPMDRGQCDSDPDAPVSNDHASRPTNKANA